MDRYLAGGEHIRHKDFDAVSSNITPDPDTGIGRWTDRELFTAIREGRRRNGSLIGPAMPSQSYRALANDDVKAIIAYLRSVKPVANKVAKSTYKVPLPPTYGPPVTTVASVSKAEKAAYGAYLAGPARHCIECHSTPGTNGAPDFVGKTGAGGLSFSGPWGTSYAANITPNGIGTWTDADIKRAITTGVRPDGVHLKPPMAFAYYKNIAADDLDAIVVYLRTLKPM